MFISIFKDSLIQVTPSFKLNEFFSKCPDFAKTSHLLDFRLITAVQAIRDYYGCLFSLPALIVRLFVMLNLAVLIIHFINRQSY